MFELAFKNIETKTTNQLEKVIRAGTFELFSSIVYDTAVDSGRARGNWQIGIDKEHNQELNTLDKSGSDTVSKAKAELEKPLGNYIYIQNNLPYIMRLEYGWSKQSPSGMARVNILRLNSIFQKVNK